MRSKPYTDKGLSRVPCLRCGKPSSQQWQICSLGNKWAGICIECDIDLNEYVLKFMRIKKWPAIMSKYLKSRTE